MSSNTTKNSDALIVTELWDGEMQEILHEQLTGLPHVRQVDFPHGDAFTWPSLGPAIVREKQEDIDVTFDALDVGEVTVTMNIPIVSGNSISKKLLQDSMFSAQLLAAVPGEQAAAVMERVETDVLSLAMNQFLGTNNQNLINNIPHRRIASGTNETITPKDFSLAKYSLKKALMPMENLIAIVDPSVGFHIETNSQFVTFADSPMATGIVETGITKNMRFIRNIYGFDVFESNLLPEMNETIDGKTTSSGVANMFMSLARMTLSPFVLAWRERPILESDTRFENRGVRFQTNAYYGTKLVRDENLVVIGSDTDQVN